MGKKVLSIALLAAATAIIGLFAFRDTPSPENPSNPESSFTPPSSEIKDVSSDIDLNDRPVNTDDDGSTMVELQEKYAEISDNPDYPQLQTRLDAMQRRHKHKSFDAEQVVDALAQPEAWARVDNPPEELPLTPVEKFDGREFIRFNPLRIETLMPGDTLEIPIWQLGTRYKMRVDHTETHENGSVTWHGHLENLNEPHRVTITVGDGLSLGGIDTPNGHYVLQAHGESGWIASSETLFKRNESETDMIIPPSGEAEENP